MRFTESILAFDCWNQVRPWCLTASHRGVYHINCRVGILYMVIRHWLNSDWHMALIWIWYDMPSYSKSMMTSSNGNILRVTGHWCGEFTGPRWIKGQWRGALMFSLIWFKYFGIPLYFETTASYCPKHFALEVRAWVSYFILQMTTSYFTCHNLS